MTNEEIKIEIEYILEMMDSFEWGSSQKELFKLWKRITETPADIHGAYGYFKE
jgi:hypothetical protein